MTLSLVIGVRYQYFATPNSRPPPYNDLGRSTAWRRLRQERQLLSVADPCTTGVEVNLSIMPQQREVITIVVKMHHQVTSYGHLPQSEDPHSGVRWRDRLVLLSDHSTREKCMCRLQRMPTSTWGCLVHVGRTTDLERGRVDKTHGRPTINVGQLTAHPRRWGTDSSDDSLGRVQHPFQVT
jgi:hypothetical protein